MGAVPNSACVKYSRIVQLHQVQGEGDGGLLAFCDGGLQGIEIRRNVFAVYGNLQRIRVEK